MMNESMNDVTVDFLKPMGASVAEISSPFPSHRRWVEISYGPVESVCHRDESLVDVDPTTNMEWRLLVFDFDCNKYPPPDDDCTDLDHIDDYFISARDKRRIEYYFCTQNKVEFEHKVRSYVPDMNKFTSFPIDYLF